jgi:putative FmdB family regulatory protein
MPTYAYACASCGPFDAMRSIADRDRDVTCPGCGGESARLVSAARLARPGDAPGGPSGESDTGSYRRMRHAAGCECC